MQNHFFNFSKTRPTIFAKHDHSFEETEEGGAKAELQYVEVSEDTEDPQTNCADKGKPWCINLSVLKIYATIYGCLCIYVQKLK
jgi:hypothetical protein